jgi:hypothetical protein
VNQSSQERGYEGRIAQWLARPSEYICAAYPTEDAVTDVANFLAEELGQQWLANYFAWRWQLLYSLKSVLNAQLRSRRLVQQFTRTYVSAEHEEFTATADESDRCSFI